MSSAGLAEKLVLFSHVIVGKVKGGMMARNPIKCLEFEREMLRSSLASEDWAKEHSERYANHSYRDGLVESIREYDEAIEKLEAKSG